MLAHKEHHRMTVTVCAAPPVSRESEEEATMRTNRTSGRRVGVRRLFAVIVLVLGALSVAPIHAATGILYVSATGHYMRGVFRDFWDKNGGLANFGYPLTEEYVDPQTNRIYQYFE